MNIKLKHIGKKYEGRSEFTLKDINLEFDNNDFIVILGPSGCGKTTLLRMIAGLNSITEGDLLFNNRRVNELDPADRGIAMVFQNYALYPHMSVFQNLAFGLKMRKARPDFIAKRVMEVAEILNISPYLYNKPKSLSGGQQQRVAIGRAIVRNPDVFLMDEPLSNLDAKLREYMRKELVKIHRLVNSTSIYVTHDQLEAMSMANKIVLMNDGVIQQVGKPFELYSSPTNIFTAKFIGSPEMNIWNGKITNNQFVSKDGLIKMDVSQSINGTLKDGEYSVGLRSENIYRANPKDRPTMIKGKVVINELQGRDRLMLIEINNDPKNTISVTDKAREIYNLNDEIEFSFGRHHIHIFDKNGNRVNNNLKIN